MDTFRRAIETLHPAYFDVVMATGILALAAHFERMWPISFGLTYLSIALAIVLCAMNAVRLFRYRPRFVRDLADFERGPGFFTIVAGLAILGSQTLTILNCPKIALALWIVSFTLWAFFNYAIFVEIIVNEHKPRFEDGINGGWLLSVVAAQSVAGLGAQLSDRLGEPRAALFLALVLWLSGGMLYIWLIALIFYRFTFFSFKPQQFMPPFWINMGAMAVSAHTGTMLLVKATGAAFLADSLPFVKGLTILFWATATWWIPMLAALAVWQHVIKNFNRPYSPLYWSAVFPLGMYAVSTYQLSRTVGLPFLMWIPRVFVYIALIAWLATVASMLFEIAHRPETQRMR